MICELTNKCVSYICWFMSYGEEEKRKIKPDTEVCIMDFVVATTTALLITLILVWWFIPYVWLYNTIKWGQIHDVLSKKRFKCKQR